MHDEVEPLEAERLDGRDGEAAETRERVVEVGRTVGEAEARQVEAQRAEAARAASSGITFR